MKKRVLLVLLQTILWRIALVWGKSWRVKRVNSRYIDDWKNQGRNYVIAFWHGSMFVGWLLHKPLPNESISALVSQSNDGAYLSAVLERWRYRMIRGSSHVGGKEAMQLMTDAVSNGSSLAITPDGPRGPRHEMKMGAVRVAQKTNVPLFLAGIAVKNKRHLKSWDKFEVPMPFTSVVVTYSEPLIVPPELANERLDKFKLDIQLKLRELTEEAERIVMDNGR